MLATWFPTGCNTVKQRPCYICKPICSSLVSQNSTATEPAVLELACVMNQVKHVVICGHSDCKALNLLYDIHTDPAYQVTWNK